MNIQKDLDANNMLCEQEVQQLWSPGLEKFLADRFVEGTCPLVSHPFLYQTKLKTNSWFKWLKTVLENWSTVI